MHQIYDSIFLLLGIEVVFVIAALICKRRVAPQVFVYAYMCSVCSCACAACEYAAVACVHVRPCVRCVRCVL